MLYQVDYTDAHAIGPTLYHKHLVWCMKPPSIDIWQSILEQVGPLDEWPSALISMMLGKHLNHAGRFSLYSFVVAANRGNPLDFAKWCKCRALFDKKGALHLAGLIADHKAGKLDKYMSYVLPFRTSSAEGFTGRKEDFTSKFTVWNHFRFDSKVDVTLQRPDTTHGNPTNFKTQKMYIETPDAAFMASEGHWFDKAVAFLNDLTSVCTLPWAGTQRDDKWIASDPLDALNYDDGKPVLTMSAAQGAAHFDLGDQPPCDAGGVEFVGGGDEVVDRIRALTADPIPLRAGDWQGSVEVDERGSMLVTHIVNPVRLTQFIDVDELDEFAHLAVPSPMRIAMSSPVQHASPRVAEATSKSEGKKRMPSPLPEPLPKKTKEEELDERDMDWLFNSLWGSVGSSELEE